MRRIKTDTWDQLAWGEAVVFNNHINQQPGGRQLIWSEDDVSACGWEWDFPTAMGEYASGAYPEILFGNSPWGLCNPASWLPCPLHELHELRIAFKANVQATGKFNLALDLWVCDSPTPGITDIKAEVMWHFRRKGFTPWKTHLKSYANHPGIGRMELWKQTMTHIETGHQWPLLIFHCPGLLEADFHAAPLLGDLIQLGCLAPDQHLCTVELGNEVIHGSGKTEVSQFLVWQ